MEELGQEIADTFASFVKNADLNTAGNKAAGVRARKATLELKKLFKEYRKLSIENGK